MPSQSLPAGLQRFSLENRVALVTGSTTGLGKAMAFALGSAGAKVALNYARSQQRAEKCFAEYEEEGLKGRLFRADVTDPDDVARLEGEIRDQLGPIDILVLNATPDQPELPIEQYDWDFYQSMLDHFIKSPYLLTRAVLPHMKAQRWGRIINIGSEVFQRGMGNFSAYVAAKGGQNGWTRSMATELGPHGITVNMISPGWIPVDRHRDVPEADKDAYLQGVPAGRFGVPEDLAGVVTLLAGDGASFVNGQNIAVNGGVTVA